MPLDPIEGFAGAAILCTVLSQHIYSRYVQSELASETICWVILPFLFKFTKPRETNRYSSIPRSQSKTHTPSSSSLWIVAACIAVASIYRAEIGVIGLLPALTPLLLIAENRLRAEWQASGDDTKIFYPLVHTIWGTGSAATFAIVVLSDWTFDFKRLVISIVLVFVLLVLYTALTARSPGGVKFDLTLDFETSIIPLSQKVTIILGALFVLQLLVFGIAIEAILPAILLGIVKALSWYSTARTTRNTSWLIATAIIIFSIISTRDPSIQSSGFQALSHVLGSILSLTQIICMLQKESKIPSVLWVLILISLIPYVMNELAIRNSQNSAYLTLNGAQQYPVETLILNGQEDFNTLSHTQSKHYANAITQYKRRYKIDPPPGFKEWFDYAQSVNSPVIDNFDSIFERISPFLKISGIDYIKAMTEAQSAPNADLWRCTFASGLAQTRCKHPYRTNDRHYGLTFNNLLKGRKHIPGVDFLVNHLDEPRIIIPPFEKRSGIVHPKISDLTHKSTWESLTRFCHNAENLTVLKEANTFGIPFVTDLTIHQDLCLHPMYAHSHGMLISPTSFYPITGLSPVLSTGALSTMGDILFPSPAYSETQFLYDNTTDIPWSKKSNTLYWAGSTTGGYATSSSWKSFQRQRFISIAQNLQRGKLHSYLNSVNGVLTPMFSTFLNPRLYNVAITKIFQCTFSTCRAQRLFFPSKPWADKDAAFHSKLVFDIDGNGISGRYYKLLASNSLVLKQTLLKEWHDERLVPWKHYVPVSQGMEELPELVRWLTSNDRGRKWAEEIAREGKAWAEMALREEDRSVYLYRLMLELARLQDVKRAAS